MAPGHSLTPSPISTQDRLKTFLTEMVQTTFYSQNSLLPSQSLFMLQLIPDGSRFNHRVCRATGSNLQMLRPGGEATNTCNKILDLAIFISQEVLSLHFSFKLGVTITLLSSTEPNRLRLRCTDLVVHYEVCLVRVHLPCQI